MADASPAPSQPGRRVEDWYPGRYWPGCPLWTWARWAKRNPSRRALAPRVLTKGLAMKHTTHYATTYTGEPLSDENLRAAVETMRKLLEAHRLFGEVLRITEDARADLQKLRIEPNEPGIDMVLWRVRYSGIDTDKPGSYVNPTVY